MGIAEFQLLVGNIYHRLEDIDNAKLWLQLAAEQGNGQAYFELAEIHAQSETLDASLVREYAQKAYENGFLLAAASDWLKAESD